jgi:hypothetical protein
MEVGRVGCLDLCAAGPVVRVPETWPPVRARPADEVDGVVEALRDLRGSLFSVYGPLHGGANEQVLRMLNQIGSVEAIPGYVDRVKQGEFRLMGFGHRVYKNFDPRAQIIKRVAGEVLAVSGSSPLLDIALELERIALEDA